MKLKDKNAYYNPFYHWWKVRKEFKRPHAHLHVGKVIRFYGLPTFDKYYKSFIDFRTSAVGWKNKYDTPRHEWDPYISIIFFKRWQIFWQFNWIDKNDKYSDTRSMATWEAILERIYFGYTLEKCIKENVWNTYKNEGGNITIEQNIKRK